MHAPSVIIHGFANIKKVVTRIISHAASFEWCVCVSESFLSGLTKPNEPVALNCGNACFLIVSANGHNVFVFLERGFIARLPRGIDLKFLPKWE